MHSPNPSPPPAAPRSLPPAERPALDAALRGVLAETALHNRQRYPWRLLAPLLHRLIDSVLADYAPPEDEVRGARAAGCSGAGPPDASVTSMLPCSAFCVVFSDPSNAARTRTQGEGPPRPPPPGFEGCDSLGAHLHDLLGGYRGAPFTLQRLCELLLEPRKQYARLDKVVSWRGAAGSRARG